MFKNNIEQRNNEKEKEKKMLQRMNKKEKHYDAEGINE